MLALALLAVFALGCSTLAGLVDGDNQPSDSPPEADDTAQSDESQPTQAVQRLERPPTPTAIEVDSSEDPRSILDLANPDHYDYFDDPETWFLYEDPQYATYDVTDGHLIGSDAVAADRAVYWSYTSFPSGNTYAEISATLGECYGRDAVGFVIRVQSDQTPSGYALEVSCDGAWRFRRLREGEPAFEIVDWTEDDRIRTGQGEANRLGIWGYRGEFVLFVNGDQVGAALDSSYAYSLGYFAVYVQSQEAFPLTATFDDFAYWNIPYQP
jgi:hypothetical protein